MDENTKKKVLEIIRKSIDEVVYGEIKKVPQRIKASQEEIKKTKAQRDLDAHNALFGNKEEEISYRLRLHESEERPKINPNELDEFQKEFKSRFPGISFDKQVGNGKNGQLVDFPVKGGQKDAFASGKILIGDQSMAFSMSLLNGFKIRNLIVNGEQKPFEIRKETKDVFGKILNLYEELFKKRFNEIINPVNAEEQGETPNAQEAGQAQATTTPAPAVAQAGAPPTA